MLMTKQQVLESVANRLGVDFLSKTRITEVMYYRHAITFVLHRNAGFNLSDIGRMIGKTHGTVINSVKVVTNLLDAKDTLMVRIHEEVYLTLKDVLGQRFKGDVEYLDMAKEIVALIKEKDPYFGSSEYSTKRILSFVRREMVNQRKEQELV